MTIRFATGKDFDRMNNMTAHSALIDLVAYASGTEDLPNVVVNKSIESRSRFIMEVW